MSGVQMVVSGLAFAVFLLFGSIWVFQTFGIYRFDSAPQSPADFGLSTTFVMPFISEDGTPLQAWVAKPAPDRPVILSFYGNFSAIGPSMQRFVPLIADGYGLVMLQYRGSGRAAGRPSEDGFARDARALYDQLDALVGQPIPKDRRVVHGFSLGSGVAVRLASERAFSGLILEAAIPRLCRYFQRRFHGLPLCHLMWSERYDSIDRIGAITAPLLFVHGAKDQDIPLLWGQQLYDAATAPKQFVTLPNGTHTDLARQGLIEAIRNFLQLRVD